MSLTAISSLESERRKFFMNSTYMMSTNLAVGIKRFWAQEAEMTLTAISSLESATRKFFMNSTDMMPTKKESNAFGIRRPK